MQSGIPHCHTCGEQVGVDANGEVFVACHECNFPICKDCLGDEIKEGRKVCLRCGMPYGGIYDLLTLDRTVFLVFSTKWLDNSLWHKL